MSSIVENTYTEFEWAIFTGMYNQTINIFEFETINHGTVQFKINPDNSLMLQSCLNCTRNGLDVFAKVRFTRNSVKLEGIYTKKEYIASTMDKEDFDYLFSKRDEMGTFCSFSKLQEKTTNDLRTVPVQKWKEGFDFMADHGVFFDMGTTPDGYGTTFKFQTLHNGVKELTHEGDNAEFLRECEDNAYNGIKTFARIGIHNNTVWLIKLYKENEIQEILREDTKKLLDTFYSTLIENKKNNRKANEIQTEMEDIEKLGFYTYEEKINNCFVTSFKEADTNKVQVMIQKLKKQSQELRPAFPVDNFSSIR